MCLHDFLVKDFSYIGEDGLGVISVVLMFRRSDDKRVASKDDLVWGNLIIDCKGYLATHRLA